jgi:hypothetical protein
MIPDGPTNGIYRKARCPAGCRLCDVAELQARLFIFRGETLAALESKPSRGAIWAMGIALFGLVVTAVAADRAYLPFLAERLHLLK